MVMAVYVLVEHIVHLLLVYSPGTKPTDINRGTDPPVSSSRSR